MKLFDRLKFSLRVILHDLFGEEGAFNENAPAQNPLARDAPEAGAPGMASLETVGALLEETQARLDALRVEMGAALAGQRLCEAERQEAQTQASALDASVDDALRQKDDELARRTLVQARQAQESLRLIRERCQASAEVTARLHEAVTAWQAQLDQARQDYADLQQRQRSAAALEDLQSFQRRFRKELASLQEDLDRRKDAIARREDVLAAREGLKKR